MSYDNKGAHQIDYILPLEKREYNLVVSQEFELTNIDKVLIGLISRNGGQMTEGELAKCLGLSISDNFEEQPYAYQDEAEISIFSKLKEDLEKHNLIYVEKQFISLTELGIEALTTNKKKIYKEARFEVHDFGPIITGQFSSELLHELKIKTTLSLSREISWMDLEGVEDHIDEQLINQFDHYYSGEIAIHQVNKDCSYKHFRVKLEFLVNDDLTQFDVINYENDSVSGLLSVLNQESNSNFRKQVIDLAVLRKNEADPNYQFNASDLEKNWLDMSFDSYTSEKIVWDDQVIQFLLEKADASHWSGISEKIPLERLVASLDKALDFWDWGLLTFRLPNDYIQSNINNTAYRWDFEILSNKELAFILELIQTINDESTGSSILNSYWEVTDRVEEIPNEILIILIRSGCFIYPNEITNRSNEFVFEVLNNCSEDFIRTLDWYWITTNWSIDELRDNIEILAKYLNWKDLLCRIFKDNEFKERFINDTLFWETFDSNGELDYPFTDEELLWDVELINLFDTKGLIQWQSSDHYKGFDCNDYVDWDEEMMSTYHHKLVSEKATLYHTSKLVDLNWLARFPDFCWSWKMLSSNPLITEHEDRIEEYKDKLDWEILPKHAADTIIEDNWDRYSWDYDALSRRKGSLKSKLVVINPTLLWDWGILAAELSFETIFELMPQLERVYGDLQPRQIRDFFKLVTGRLPLSYLLDNHNSFSFDWDWQLITTQIDKEILLENLDDSAQKFDWQYISSELLTSDDIRELISDLYEYIDWNYILSRGDFDSELSEDQSFLDLLIVLSSIGDDQRRAKAIQAVTMTIGRLAREHDDFDFLKNSIDNSLIGGYQLDWSCLSDFDIDYTLRLLEDYLEYWDWDILSNNSSINSKEVYLDRFVEKWNWSFLSIKSEFFKSDVNEQSEQRREDNLISALKRYEHKIDWKEFSNRGDVYFTSRLIAIFSKYDWDYPLISKSENLKIDTRFILRFGDKEWDWSALSNNIGFDFSRINEEQLTILFASHPWNYQALSIRKDFEVTVAFITQLYDRKWDFYSLTKRFKVDQIEQLVEILGDKEIDWEWVSRMIQKPSPEFLNENSSKIEWDTLSQNIGLIIDLAILKDYSNKWDFFYLSLHPLIHDNLDWILDLPDKNWNWLELSKRISLHRDIEIVRQLSFKFDWLVISENVSATDLNLYLMEFKELWNYALILNNYEVERDSELVKRIKFILSSQPQIEFNERILSSRSHWAGYVYHFTHLTNAIEIINSQKILSRNAALEKGFSDAAGSVVDRKHDAHQFARFYFRPQTPTQFYNEFLGIDSSSKYYNQARNLNLPRCPVPIFFLFDIKEILSKMGNDVSVSNGNMQTNRAAYGPIGEMMQKFHFADLFSTIASTSDGDWKTYLNYSQQEFLVKNHLDFSTLDSTKIIVPDQSSYNTLINHLKVPDLKEKIVIGNGNFDVYSFQNSHVNIDWNEGKLNVSTNFNDDHMIIIEIGSENYSVTGNVISSFNQIVKGKNSLCVNLPENSFFKVSFRDTQKREWEIFSN